jgi:hypothetical protein
MRVKQNPFVCPRCGYKTQKKWDMIRHLYQRSVPCHGEVEDLELTEEIKQCIIKNKIYHRPKEKEQSNTTIINNVIQNYNSFNSMISVIDVADRIMHLSKFKNTPIIDLEQSVEDKYCDIAKKLDNNSYKLGFEMNHEDMLETIDDVSNTKKNLQNFNIIYDTISDKIKIYEGEWEEYMLTKGVRKIITAIKDYYWDAYECYLLRKLNSSSNAFEKQRCRELLKEYYHFISCFEIDPFAKDRCDSEILGDESGNSYDVSDTYYPLYTKEKDNIGKTKSIPKEMKKKVIDIIKRNTEKNIKNLNREVYDIFSMEDGFRNIIMSSVQGIFPKDLSSKVDITP